MSSGRRILARVRLGAALTLGIACAPAPVTAPGPVAAPAPQQGPTRAIPPATSWPGQACRQRAARLLAEMTLSEKIAAMTLPDTGQLDGTEVTARGFSSLLTGAESLPAEATAERWLATATAYREAVARSRLGHPLLYGTDAIHGHNHVRGAVVFPHALGLGCSGDPGLIERVAAATAESLAATGLDWTFAPLAAVARDERWGRTYEAFGEDPRLVAELTAAAVRGLQGSPPGSGAHPVLACAKHFLADGGTVNGEDRGNAELTPTELRALHLAPYAAAVEARVGSVMVAPHRVNGRWMHQHRSLITDVLKGELAFGGFVVSNWSALDALPGDYGERVASAVESGVDLVMAPRSLSEFTATLEGLVPHRISPSRIDDAVSRILMVKCELGLFEAGARPRPPASVVGSARHRQLAREAVARSVVLLKNEGLLPLDPAAQILLAGRNADDLGHQCGGWTLGLNGGSGPITEGTTIRQGIERVVGAHRLRYAADGRLPTDEETAVVVIGEVPYAEGAGYRRQLTLDADDVTAVRNAASTNAPVVVVLVTGRPLPLDLVLELADALLVVWLPGTEGDGIADVLFGAVPPTGRLSHTWPRTSGQIPINIGDASYDPLFPFGFGLTFRPRRPSPVPTDDATPDAATPPAAPASVLPPPSASAGEAPRDASLTRPTPP